ncbi:Hypothetical Protein FCC1311_072082 [Hondaea fermentalgiana]|uniref:Uncharacterized protein n=1 Tax=Hondaea fermentalgiana TaxID=2315210 RepID=A0A2R5GJC9_9STRA|nr:Hypothetical Protein FCC1311_072082 [Hondaea fermentalgiana]|eukprot:GBG30987.1 Hypothetical Protein FCC1311_072082 [Hondaea fermentalgiana]
MTIMSPTCSSSSSSKAGAGGKRPEAVRRHASASEIRGFTPQEQDELLLGGEKVMVVPPVRSSSQGQIRFRKRRGTPVPMDLGKLRSQLAALTTRARSSPSASSLPSVQELTPADDDEDHLENPCIAIADHD